MKSIGLEFVVFLLFFFLFSSLECALCYKIFGKADVVWTDLVFNMKKTFWHNIKNLSSFFYLNKKELKNIWPALQSKM